MNAWHPSPWHRLLRLIESCLALALKELGQAGTPKVLRDMARLQRLAELLRRLGQ